MLCVAFGGKGRRGHSNVGILKKCYLVPLLESYVTQLTAKDGNFQSNLWYDFRFLLSSPVVPIVAGLCGTRGYTGVGVTAQFERGNGRVCQHIHTSTVPADALLARPVFQ